MIGRLKGLYDGQSEDHAIIDCGGVGYRVFASSRTLGQLGPIGQAVTLEIETQVREDHIHRFGFLSERLDWLSRLVKKMRGTKQTGEFMSSLGPFFVGHTIYQFGAEDS